MCFKATKEGASNNTPTFGRQVSGLQEWLRITQVDNKSILTLKNNKGISYT